MRTSSVALLMLATILSSTAFVIVPSSTSTSIAARQTQLFAAPKDDNIFDRFSRWQMEMVQKTAKADPRREEWIVSMMKQDGVTREVAEEEVTAYTIDPLGYMIKRNRKKAEAEGRKVLTRPSRLDSFLPRFGGDDKKK